MGGPGIGAALALRGALSPAGAALGLAVAAGFVVFARVTWMFAVRHYASASS